MRQKTVAESARRLRIGVILLSAIIVAVYVASRLDLQWGSAFRIERRDQNAVESFPYIRDIALLLFLAAMFEVTRLLGRLGAGEMFTPGVTRAFRGFAFWLLMSALVSILGPAIMSLVQPHQPGRFGIVVLVDLKQMMFIVAALVLFLVARVLDAASQIDSELKEIV